MTRLRHSRRTRIILALVLAASTSLAARPQAFPPAIAQAKDLNELRARTSDEKTLAAYYDLFGIDGHPIYEGGAVIVGPGMRINPPAAAKPPTYLQFLHEHVCATTAVVVGRPIRQRVFMNGKETFLFTVYSFQVDHSARPIYIPQFVDVAMPGGDVQLRDGRRLQAGAATPLELNSLYILFLERIPSTNSYKLKFPPALNIQAGLLPAEGVTDEFDRRVSSPGLTPDRYLSDLEEANRTCTALAAGSASRVAGGWPVRGRLGAARWRQHEIGP